MYRPNLKSVTMTASVETGNGLRRVSVLSVVLVGSLHDLSSMSEVRNYRV